MKIISAAPLLIRNNSYVYHKEANVTEPSISSFWQTAQLREKFTIIIGILYILLPIDFVPEIVLGPLGLLDDGGALLAVVYTAMGVLNRQRSIRRDVIDGEEINK